MNLVDSKFLSDIQAIIGINTVVSGAVFYLNDIPFLHIVGAIAGLVAVNIVIYLIYCFFEVRRRTQKRKSYSELCRVALRRGWDVEDLYDLVSAIRQEASEGEVLVWGRKKKQEIIGSGIFYKELLQKIPNEHWLEFHVYWQGIFTFDDTGAMSSLGQSEQKNSSVHTFRYTKSGVEFGFMDLMVDVKNIDVFFTVIESKYRGGTKKALQKSK